jgi:hypothetical protein
VCFELLMKFMLHFSSDLRPNSDFFIISLYTCSLLNMYNYCHMINFCVKSSIRFKYCICLQITLQGIKLKSMLVSMAHSPPLVLLELCSLAIETDVSGQ